MQVLTLRANGNSRQPNHASYSEKIRILAASEGRSYRLPQSRSKNG